MNNEDRKPLESFNEFVDAVVNYVDVYNPKLPTPNCEPVVVNNNMEQFEELLESFQDPVEQIVFSYSRESISDRDLGDEN